ncbi:S41 family peptidase [Maridesulfovibrio sp.]|uniref:S41 family peptidase n=1 Tax=Maridesulfovibrio sp. TaxID=2795000 RepID=UPI003AFFB140
MLNKLSIIAFFRKYALLFFAISSILIFNGNTGCSSTNEQKIFKKLETQDCSNDAMLDAYDKFHAFMVKTYAFGHWKSIDWVALNNEIRPQIVVAENTNDTDAYITALLKYTRSIPDGHVTWENTILPFLNQFHEGSYGFGIAELDDGRVIATTVTTNGPAARAGIIVGDEILEWNDVAITTAAAEKSILWRPNPASIATNELKKYEQYRALTLAPVNTSSRIKFSRPDGSAVTTVMLTTVNDNTTIQQKTEFWKKIDDNDPIKYKILPSGYGYIQLGTLESKTISFDQLFDKFKEAMNFLTSRNVPGLIIDLRANGGGSDDLAAKISGFFYSETTFYEYQNLYNTYNDQRQILLPSQDDSYIIGWGIPLNITPQSPQFTRPIVALVNPDTTSSAEGVAMAIRNLPNGYVVGLYGTNGSFGMTGGEIEMPYHLQANFPTGQSLDQFRVIQLDSKNGIGGIAPTNRVPRTSENMIKYVKRIDVELDFAINFLQSLETK